MKGIKGAIWHGLTILTVLAMILGALPLAPAAQAAPGDTRAEAVHLWNAGSPSSSLGGNLGPAIPFWYHIGYTTNAQGVDIKLDPPGGMATFDVFYQQETMARMSNTRFYSLPANSQIGDYYVQVRGYMPESYTIIAAPSAGGGGYVPPGGGPNPTPIVTPGDGSGRQGPIFLVLNTPSSNNINYPAQTSRWYMFDYNGGDTVTVELRGDPVLTMNVYKGSNQFQEPGGSYTRFFTLSGAWNAGQYFLEVRGATTPTQTFTISAYTGAGGGTAGDSRSNPDVIAGPVSPPLTRSVPGAAVPSKWFSREFVTGVNDLEVTVGTPDPNVQLWVYYLSSSSPLPQSDGRKFFKLGAFSPSGTYVFEVRNVQGVSFSVTFAEPMAAGGCSQNTPCQLGPDMPFHGNAGPNASVWFEYNHIDAGRRARVELLSSSGSVVLNVRQGSKDATPVANNVSVYPMGDFPSLWYFQVVGGFMGGDFDIQVYTESASQAFGPGGGPDRWSAPELGMGGYVMGELGAQGSTWFRFGFFGEPARIALTQETGGPFNLNIYYGYAGYALDSNAGVSPTKVYTLTSNSSYGDYFVNVVNAQAPGRYNIKAERAGEAGGAGSSQSSAISLPAGQDVNQTFTGNKIWFAFDYDMPFQPVDINLTGMAGGLAFDVFFGLSPAPIGTSYPMGVGQAFKLSSPNTGLYYVAVRSMGYMPGPVSIPITMRANAGAGPAAGLPMGDRYNPQRLESDLEVKGYLSPQQNYWYSYDVPQGKRVELALVQGDRGTALNVYGSEPNPIAPGVRNWVVPPFFGQPTVFINIASPFGGNYSLIARTSSAVAGDGSSREGAIALPAEVEIRGSMSGLAKRLWYVYQHMGMTTTFKLKKNDGLPHDGVTMDIFAGDSTFPQPGSGGNSGFLGGATPPGPVFIVVNRKAASDVNYTIIASTQIDFGSPPGGGPGGPGGMFQQPSTSLKAGVYSCGGVETLVPKGRVAVLYNGQVITTVTTVAGTMDVSPSALPNSGRDGHYDLRGLPPKAADITSDQDPGANCAPGYSVGVDINGGLVFPAGDPQVGQHLLLQDVQLQGTVTAPDGTTPVAKAKVKATPDFGGTAAGTGGFGGTGAMSVSAAGTSGPSFGPGGDDQAVVVLTNNAGKYRMGGFMPGIPYAISAYPPDPDDGGPGEYAQSQSTKTRFSGAGFNFGFVGTPGGTGGYGGTPPGGGYQPGGYGGYQPGGYGGYQPGGYGGYQPGGFGGAGIATARVKKAVDQAQTANLSLTTANILGSVRNPAGSTVAGAKVVAQEEFGSGFGPALGPQSSSVNIEGFSDSNGTYRLGALSSGKTYKIIAKPPETGSNSVYKASQPKRQSYAGTQLTGVDLTLASPQITITVASGGVGIPGARVELMSIGSFGPGVFYQEETDSNGRATFGGLTDGQYNIISFPPPDPKYFHLAPAAPQQTKVSNGSASPSSVSFSLGAASLTGIVYKSDGSTPATMGVSVEIFKNDFTFHYGVGVNEQGAFAAGGMPAGNYKVQARVHGGSFGFGQQTQDTDSVAKDVTIGSDGKPDSSWDGKLVLGSPQVTIYVVDPDGNTPSFPVHVSEIGDMGQPVGEGTETDPSTGQALIGGLADGAHQFGVFLPPMLPFAAPEAQSVTITNGEANPSTVTFQLVTPKKKVTGTIKKFDSTAVTNAGVHAFREDGSGNSDTFVNSTGAYELKLAKGGTWLLVIFPMFGGPGGGKEGGMQKSRSVKDLASELDWIFTEEPRRVEFTQADDVAETLADVNFTVAKANASVKGKVLIEATGKAPNAGTTFVDVRDETGIGNGVPLSEDGTFTVAVPSGITARVRVFSKDPSLSQKGDPPYVEPKEGTPVEVGNIYLTQLALTISGKVVIAGATDANGEAIGVENVEVTAFKEGGMGFARTTSTTGGVFTLPVGGGEWRVHARPGKGSRYTPKGRPVEVEVENDPITGLTLEVQAADGEITANLAWAQGVQAPFAISNLFGFGIALEQPSNSLAAGTSMERGSFKLRVPSGKRYTVSVDFPPGLSFGANPQTVDLTTATTATVQIAVAVANANIIGEWKDSSGTRVQNLDADVYANGPKGHKSAALSATGRYNLSLIAGTWYIGGKMKSSGYAVIPPASNKVEAVAGDIVDGPTFTVVQASSKILGTVKDPNGGALIARVWAETKPTSASEAPRLVADTLSSGTGAYEMSIPAGTYVVRAAVPPEKGYLPPLPIQAEIPDSGQVTVNFQFRAPEVTISGNVAGPGAATALVTAYSNKGAWASTMVTTTGAFSYTLNATQDDVWHIVAASSVVTNVYRSDPITLTVGKENISGRAGRAALRNIRSAQTDLVLKRVEDQTLPAGSSVTFDSTSMQVLALDDGTQVTIPSGALATSGDVTVYAVPTEKLTSQPNAQSRFIGYNLKAFDSNNVEIKKFKQTVTLRVPYPSDAALAAAGLEESKLKPMYYDTTSGSWVVSEPYTQDTVNNIFIITTDHFTIFAGILTAGAEQVGTSSVKIYVPFASKLFSPGW